MFNTSPHPYLADATEIERGAFNAAFQELGLRWHWDSTTYDAIVANPCERTRVRHYLESKQSHLLRVLSRLRSSNNASIIFASDNRINWPALCSAGHP